MVFLGVIAVRVARALSWIRLALTFQLQSQVCAIDIHDAFYLLQHRGQDAVGVAIGGQGGRIYSCKGILFSGVS